MINPQHYNNAKEAGKVHATFVSPDTYNVTFEQYDTFTGERIADLIEAQSLKELRGFIQHQTATIALLKTLEKDLTALASPSVSDS